MISHVVSYILMILSIDLFYIVNKKYKEFFLKRQNKIEEKFGIADENKSKLEDVFSLAPTITYGIITVVCGFYFNFIEKDIFKSTSFFSILLTNVEMIALLTLICFNVGILIKYFRNLVCFIKGFAISFKTKDDN